MFYSFCVISFLGFSELKSEMLVRLCCKLQLFDGYRDIRFGTRVNDVSFERRIEVRTLSLVGFVFDCSGLLIVTIFGHEFFDFSRS